MNALKRPIRFLSIFALVLSAVLLGNGGTAAAANPLLCFDGTTDTANGDTGGFVYGGVCTLNAAGTVATLNNTVPVGSGDYSGVYFAVTSLSGMLLSDITELSFTYTGTPTAGSPRMTLPIDTDNDGDTDFWLSIGAFYCNNGSGLVNPLTDPTCTLWSNEDGTTPLASNWAALVLAHPTWRVATEDLPFIIADDPGLWTVSNVQLGGKATFASAKDECKKGGWADLTRADGTSFNNQGDCIQYVNTGK